MYEVSKGIVQKIITSVFSSNAPANYDLRCESDFIRPPVKSVVSGTETILYLCPRIWDLVALEMKQKESLTTFKKPLRLGTHIKFRVDCAKNMFSTLDLVELRFPKPI